MMMIDPMFLPPAPARSTRFSLRAIAALVLFSASALATAQTGLPQGAVSIPVAGTLQGSLKAASQCGEETPLVLPKVSFSFAAEASQPFAEQARVIQGLPSSAQAWLDVSLSPESLTGKETEKQLTEQVGSFLKLAPLSAAAVRGIMFEPGATHTASDLFVYALLRLAVEAKSANPSLRVAFVFPAGFIGQNGDTVKRLALYADLLGTSNSGEWRSDADWIAKFALNKPLLLKLDSADPASYLHAVLANSGSTVEMFWSSPRDSATANQLCAASGFLARTLPANLLRMEAKVKPFTLTIDGTESDNAVWFTNSQSGDLVLLAAPQAPSAHPKTLVLQGATKTPYEVQWSDPETGNRIAASESGMTATGVSPFVLATLHKKASSATTAFNQVEVKGDVSLSVEEIIARWQQVREAQKKRLENYQASNFMSLHFESTNVAQAFDISMRLKLFYARDGKTEMEQTEFYVNGVKFSNKHEFPLPQLEPEKVLTQPLELTLNERYTYKLLGTELMEGAQCYVVGVEPKVADEKLYSGKIWIDGVSFREVRQTLNQRAAHSSVLINVETQNFALVSDGQGNQYNLPRSVTAQQTLNAAGRDFQLQRTLQFSNYAINTPHLQQDLETAHRSDAPMYRDTEQGLRELKIKGGERVLQETSQKRIISLVGGLMYAGTFSFPIPFAGVSMADFDFRHSGAQLSTFFAGPIMATNLSKQYGSQYRLSADLALSALPGENRVYNGNVENTAIDIWAWEQTVGGRASWQASSHLSMTAFTYVAYDVFRRTSDTAPTFEPPRNGVTLLPGLQIRLTDKGYIFTADGTRGQRLNWRGFGYAGSTARVESAYTLYDADLNKDYYIRKFTKAGWDMAYYGSEQTDRFSRYFPSFFSSPRIHGIPGGTDSFDAIAMARAHYGFNVMDLMKFEALYSYARARNLDESSHFKRYDGLETNFNTAGPKGTLIQGTVSYALDGNIARYNSRWGLNIMVFKPF
jgi:hypothetical protein